MPRQGLWDSGALTLSDVLATDDVVAPPAPSFEAPVGPATAGWTIKLGYQATPSNSRFGLLATLWLRQSGCGRLEMGRSALPGLLLPAQAGAVVPHLGGDPYNQGGSDDSLSRNQRIWPHRTSFFQGGATT